ncbi:MAG: inositol monophosphatase [Candidatus Babeliales bacterium]
MHKELKLQVEPIIRKAGEILLFYYHKQMTWRDKKDQGFVTEADLASETFLMQELANVMPEASFFAEESGKRGNQDADYCWVIDPLDGTTNFAFGIPYFCISVALTYKQQPVFGMIYVPLFDELFYAQKGAGAFLNDQKITVSKERSLDRSLFLVGFPYAKGKAFLSVLHHLEDISPRTYAFRHLGAIALDQAYVACGRADGIFFEDLSWWDVAAGLILIQEAGGIVSTYTGKPVIPGYRSYVAGADLMHRKLLSFFHDQNVKID